MSIVLLALIAAAPLPSVGGPGGYADTADLALSAPLVVEATIIKTTRLSEKDSAGIPSGKARLYVEATVNKLVYGRQSIPSVVTYLIDVPLDTRGKPPKLKGASVLLFASGADNGQLRLIAPDGQIGWNPQTDSRVRSILESAQTSEGRVRITGVGNAFHVEGNVPGESESQIFLTTADARPVSLSILRRPGEQPKWSVALSEMTDDAASAPARDTILWYRLACSLPATLPASTTASLGEGEAKAVVADYGVVTASLGPCGRTRG